MQVHPCGIGKQKEERLYTWTDVQNAQDGAVFRTLELEVDYRFITLCSGGSNKAVLILTKDGQLWVANRWDTYTFAKIDRATVCMEIREE